MTPPIGDKTLEIARRTRKNLEYIYKAKSNGEDVEEFTQLLNSMLGIVISLKEDYYAGSEIAWDKVKSLGSPNWDERLPKICGKQPTPESPNLVLINSFSELIEKLRHSFAHNCFEFTINNNKELITGITAWNVPSRKQNEKYVLQNRSWEADIPEDELKSLAYLLVEYLEKEIAY